MARILLVDQSLEVRTVIGAILQRDRHEMWLAADFSEAMSSYRNFRPDLVIAEIFLPEFGGLELIRALRFEFGEVVILALTEERYAGYSDVTKTALELGAEGVISKTFTNLQLLRAVNELLSEKAVATV